MIYLAAGLGLALVIYMMLQAYARADSKSLQRVIKSSLMVLVGLIAIGVLTLALSGRWALLPLFALIVGVFIRLMSTVPLASMAGGSAPEGQGQMTRAEALEVLGLQEGASQKEIQAAYKKLMAQLHPDKGGNDWMAAKINQAREILLNSQKK